VAVPLVSMARDGDPTESTMRVTVASDAASPTVSATPRTKGLNGCAANPWPARADLAGH